MGGMLTHGGRWTSCLIALVLAAMTATTAVAQSAGAVVGTVRDATGAPLPRVEMVVEGTTRVSRTDESGAYALADLPAGRVVILARRLGYEPARQAVEVVAGESRTLDWRLQAAALRMDALAVTARREPSDSRLAGFRQRSEDKSSGHIITRDRIEQTGNRNLIDAIRSIPGVRTLPGGRAGRTVRLRGARCAPLVFIDGFPATATEFDLDAVDLHMVEGIEVYPSSSSLPPEFFGPRGLEQCGVIAIWSRPTQPRAPRPPQTGRDAERAAEETRRRAFTAGQVDIAAEMTTAEPEVIYPDSLWRSNASGSATLEFVVDERGRIDWATLRVVSATHEAFARAVEQALVAIRWYPAERQGRPVAQLVVLPVRFSRDVPDA